MMRVRCVAVVLLNVFLVRRTSALTALQPARDEAKKNGQVHLEVPSPSNRQLYEILPDGDPALIHALQDYEQLGASVDWQAILADPSFHARLSPSQSRSADGSSSFGQRDLAHPEANSVTERKDSMRIFDALVDSLPEDSLAAVDRENVLVDRIGLQPPTLPAQLPDRPEFPKVQYRQSQPSSDVAPEETQDASESAEQIKLQKTAQASSSVTLAQSGGILDDVYSSQPAQWCICILFCLSLGGIVLWMDAKADRIQVPIEEDHDIRHARGWDGCSYLCVIIVLLLPVLTYGLVALGSTAVQKVEFFNSTIGREVVEVLDIPTVSAGQRAIQAAACVCLTLVVALVILCMWRRSAGNQSVVSASLLAQFLLRGATLSIMLSVLFQFLGHVLLEKLGMKVRTMENIGANGWDNIWDSQMLPTYLMLLIVSFSEEWGKLVAVTYGTCLSRGEVKRLKNRGCFHGWLPLWFCGGLLVDQKGVLAVVGVAAGCGFMTVENAGDGYYESSKMNGATVTATEVMAILVRLIFNIHPWLTGLSAGFVAHFAWETETPDETHSIWTAKGIQWLNGENLWEACHRPKEGDLITDEMAKHNMDKLREWLQHGILSQGPPSLSAVGWFRFFLALLPSVVLHFFYDFMLIACPVPSTLIQLLLVCSVPLAFWLTSHCCFRRLAATDMDIPNLQISKPNTFSSSMSSKATR